MRIKTWERYFLAQVLKTFFLFIFSFYTLYVLIDYATHLHHFHASKTAFQWEKLFLFYFFDFIKLMEVLIPFALMVSTIKAVTNLNVNNELVALLAAGIPLKKLLRPFLYLAFFFTLLLFLNTEIFLPKALKEIQLFKTEKSIAKTKNLGKTPVLHLTLEDGSTLIFQNFEQKEERFNEAYWVASLDEIYRIKFLYPKKKIPIGLFVEELRRHENGHLTTVASYEKKNFDKMHFNPEFVFEFNKGNKEQSYQELYQAIPSFTEIKSEKQAHALTNFFYKLAMPWLAFLSVVAPLPFCVYFTRYLPLFMIYAFSLFGLVAFYIIMNAAVILGERQVLMPLLAIGIPFGLFFSFFTWRYLRLS